MPGITRRGFQTSVLDWEHSNISVSISIYLVYIYIYLVGSPPLFCAEEAFLTLSATTKAYHVQHVIHMIPGMYAKNISLTKMVATTSTSCTVYIYVRRLILRVYATHIDMTAGVRQI